MAISSASQFWAVLLARVVFNLAYGPWEGSSWWEKLQGSAVETARLLPVDGPIWAEFYPRVCRGWGEVPTWTKAHKEYVLRKACDEGSQSKLGRMAMNRWFSYVKCVPEHLPQWHSRLLFILMIGIRLGVYRDHSEFPLWGGLAASKTLPSDDGEAVEEAEEKAVAMAEVSKSRGRLRLPRQKSLLMTQSQQERGTWQRSDAKCATRVPFGCHHVPGVCGFTPSDTLHLFGAHVHHPLRRGPLGARPRCCSRGVLGRRARWLPEDVAQDCSTFAGPR